MQLMKLDQRIRQFAINTPDKIAIECGEKNISYKKFDEESSHLANVIMDNFRDINNVVVIMDKSIELIVSIMGIIKAGKVFVPGEYNATNKKIKSLVEEVEANLLITSYESLAKAFLIMKMCSHKIKILVIGDEENIIDIEHTNYENVLFLKDFDIKEGEYKYSNNENCYIYSTSGSTGKPKHILGKHESLVHFIDWEIRELEIKGDARVSQLTPPTFDPFLRDVFVPLCAGGSLIIPENMDSIRNPLHLTKWIEDKRITLIHTVPSLFKIWSNEIDSYEPLKTLKHVILAGEILRGNDIRKFIQVVGSNIQLVNMYGPTETTLAKLFYKIKEEDINRMFIPVGKPIDFAQVYILDKNMKKCGVGIEGDIYIRTPFMTAGYYKNEELTKKLFITNPFTKDAKDIIYSTGDRGRKLSDNNIEVTGRADNQVKIRGVRVELKGIENILLGHAQVKDAIVLSDKDSDDNYTLRAFINDEKGVSSEELRSYLAEHFAENIIPNHFYFVDSFPLNKNGKVDRQKLLLHIKDIEENDVQIDSAMNSTEEKLLEIWKNEFNNKKIGTNSNFFELGGHSLTAAKLMAEIYKKFQVNIGIDEIFKKPNIKELSDLIRTSEQSFMSKIPKAELKESYIATKLQKKMYLLYQFNKDNLAYNLPISFTINGILEYKKIEEILQKLVERHEILRTSFELNDENELVQIINSEVKVDLKYTTNCTEDINSYREKFIKPFELNKAPLLRAEVIKLKEQKHLVLFDIHHIIADITSLHILYREFMDLYSGYELGELNLQFKDYSEWKNNYLDSLNKESYWEGVFSNEIPELSMPIDFKKLTFKNFKGEQTNIKINKKDTQNIKNLARATDTTLYMVLLAGIKILLSKYSGQQDILVGSAMAGRNNAEVENIIGLFVNTIPLRSQPTSDKSFNDYLMEIKDIVLLGIKNQEEDFEELIYNSKLAKDVNSNALFDVFFTMHETEVNKLNLDQLSIENFTSENRGAKFDLDISANIVDEELWINIDYNTNIYKNDTIARIIKHLQNILIEISENKNKKISQISLLDNDERKKLQFDLNETQKSFSIDKTIQELFEEQVKKNPNKIAISFEKNDVTYHSLNQKANSLAMKLKEKNAKPGQIIGIMVERSIEMVVGILGILKAGGSYLPLDPDYPLDRLNYMLNESKTKIVLSTKNLSSLKKNLIPNIEIIDINNEDCKDELYIENPLIVNKSSDIAYIIFTSGSTGKPKGVMVEHTSLINFINGVTEKINFSPDKSILSMTTMSFDIFFLETILPLTQGLKVVIANKEMSKDVNKIKEVIVEQNIDMLQLTPSGLQMIFAAEELTCLRNVKDIMIGGEAFPQNLLMALQTHTNANIYNMYGPTETTVWSAISDVTHSKQANIGEPIANTSLYILNNDGLLQAIGLPGEIHIGGKGLARGYLHNSLKTEESFIDNPFSEGKIYKTGDIAKRLSNGQIEFIGRADNQVKIRGHRIELGEIEKSLNELSGVREAIVIKQQNNSNIHLHAYLTLRNNKNIQVKEELEKTLPKFMIPEQIFIIDKMPLTPSGKVDKEKLINMKSVGKDKESIPARNYLESVISEIWKETLKTEKIFVDDDFFEIGGTSLNIVEVTRKINEEIGVEINISDLVVNNSISKLAKFILELNNQIKFKNVFKINNSNSKQNIFIVHGAGGDILYYRKLAKLLEDKYSVYGIQPKGLDGKEPFPRSYYEIIRDYIKEIRLIQNDGPYIIAGYCIGGIVSYDIVNVMELQGDKVVSLIEIDQEAFLREELYKSINRNKEIIGKIEKWRVMRKKDKGYTTEMFSKLMRKAKLVDGAKQREILGDSEKLKNYFGRELVIQSNYNSLGFVKSPILVIKAKGNNHALLKEELWNKMSEGTLNFIETTGDHDSILDEPHVQAVANIIEDYLKQIENK
ncbi:amino acid adenylation domain-containing protein [Lysinibacillus xylanilyticus]|uniref:amino acid adenylation domain-containing protein n=1 Tax=Lysinibacillus xylanilyticus TaxID=582475 RepID=UPI00380BA923